jgi:hypothetical protein
MSIEFTSGFLWGMAVAFWAGVIGYIISLLIERKRRGKGKTK